MWSNKKPAEPPADAGSTSAADAAEAPASATRASTGIIVKEGKEGKRKVLQGTKYQYELGRKLGQGGYAKVKYATTIEPPEDAYAVKIFKVSLLKRRRIWDAQQAGFKTAFDDVQREIAIMKRLSNPNVMRMHDVVDDASVNKLYMVMDYCPKGAVMETDHLPCDPLDHEDCKKWFADSVVGLEYLHFQGVIHYDLKPDNILIAGDGRAVISDFGVSRVHPDRSCDAAVGSPGTPTYTAPEVWGSGTYKGRLADVWSLGVTLHAMVFGHLPYEADNQSDLIGMVTDPTEWSCGYKCDDKALLELLTGMMQKTPAKRFPLDKVAACEWVAEEHDRSKGDAEWSKIEVSEEELKSAISHGHVGAFKKQKEKGTILKKAEAQEHKMYEVLHADSAISPFLPKLISHKDSTGKRVILELEDLTHNLSKPCVMDVKMGLRTFSEEEAHVSGDKPRNDLMTKMLKVSADAATEEEQQAGGITKLRYLKFRDEASSTTTLGFRVDNVDLSGECDTTEVPDMKALAVVATREQVKDVISHWVQERKTVATSFAASLRELRTTLAASDVFASHCFLRSSLLFVYDGASDQARVCMIDLPRTKEAPTKLKHDVPWVDGNNEDGYLTGVDNLIEIFEALRDE